MPMKCITLLTTNKEGQTVKSKAVRTTAEIANRLVADGKAKFSSKQNWKSDGRLFIDKNLKVSTK